MEPKVKDTGAGAFAETPGDETPRVTVNMPDNKCFTKQEILELVASLKSHKATFQDGHFRGNGSYCLFRKLRIFRNRFFNRDGT